MKKMKKWGIILFIGLCFLSLSINGGFRSIASAQSETEPFNDQLSIDERMLDVLDLKNMDILDVLKLISQKSGLNIIAGQNVKGRVTVFLKNIEALDALKIIVEAYGWAYACHSPCFSSNCSSSHRSCCVQT